MSTESAQEISQQTTPGQLLCIAREQCGLTIDAIAQQLRLSVQTIKDIEADHYAHIGVKTFVRGYLCGYARLVHLPESRILAAFDAMDAAFADQSPHIPFVYREDFSAVNKNRRPFLLRLGLLFSGVAILAVAFLLFRHNVHQTVVQAQPLAAKSTQTFELVSSSKS